MLGILDSVYVFAYYYGDPTPSQAKGGVLVATGNRGGLFAVERMGIAAQWLAPPQGQVTALTLGADGAVWAGTANPAALWKLARLQPPAAVRP